jgi:hypothetical protein
VRLRVEHPTLRTGRAGATEVSEPREGVVLRLERGPVVRIRAQEPLTTRFASRLRVLFFVGEPSATPAFSRTEPLADGGIEVGAPPPGTYTLWIDAPPFAPFVLRGLQIGTDDIDLGQRAFPVGSSVRLHVLVKEGEAAPRLALSAQCSEHPGHTRSLNSGGETDVTLHGLGPGRFGVSWWIISGSGLKRPPAPTIITVDGAASTVHEIELDLR